MWAGQMLRTSWLKSWQEGGSEGHARPQLVRPPDRPPTSIFLRFLASRMTMVSLPEFGTYRSEKQMSPSWNTWQYKIFSEATALCGWDHANLSITDNCTFCYSSRAIFADLSCEYYEELLKLYENIRGSRLPHEKSITSCQILMEGTHGGARAYARSRWQASLRTTWHESGFDNPCHGLFVTVVILLLGRGTPTCFFNLEPRIILTRNFPLLIFSFSGECGLRCGVSKKKRAK